MATARLQAMPPNRVAPSDRSTQVKRVLAGLLVANLCVVVAKLIVAFRTGSLGVMGDAVHSSVDAVNNILALAVIWVAAREPDEDHPYGHEKFETLGALAIVVFLSITCFELAKGALARLAQGGTTVEAGPIELGVLGATLVINTIVTVYETRRGRQLNSEILLADATHTRADVIITIGVLIGVVAARAGYWYVDSIVALLVAGIIVVLAYRIVARSVPVLVDQLASPPSEIRRAAEGIGGVVQAYDIRSRGGEERRFAELTIAVKGDATVEAAHEIADAVENRLQKDLGFHEVIVHIEPC
jgi:cation diffusion facilitator family transporter